MSKPVIFYIDDEEMNLAIFEAQFTDDLYEIYTYSDPLVALNEIEKLNPWVVYSDQRMKGMNGTKFLQMVKKLSPCTVCSLITGYSSEDLIIEAINTVRLFDFIRKPFDPERLLDSIERAIKEYSFQINKEQIIQKNIEQEQELKNHIKEIESSKDKIELLLNKNQSIIEEFKCWVHPYLVDKIANKELESIKFPFKADLVGITFDIINSSKIHGVNIDGKPLRSIILKYFSESMLRNGGWVEHRSGDSAFGHFGLFNKSHNPFKSALAVSREFKTSLMSIKQVHGHKVECGIAMGYFKSCTVELISAQINNNDGILVQKSIETNSPDVDKIHRMEKLVHGLEGTNIVIDENFYDKIKDVKDIKCHNIGRVELKGIKKPVNIYLIPSYFLEESDISDFIDTFKPTKLAS